MKRSPLEASARLLLLLLAMPWVCSTVMAAPSHSFWEPSRTVPFDGTFGNFQQKVGMGAVRLSDAVDSWGGAVDHLERINLSALSDARFVVVFWPGPRNSTSTFTLELYDAAGNSGKWSFLASGGKPGVKQTSVSRSTLGKPESGVQDFQNLNLTQITKFQILGEYNSPEPFDLFFASVRLVKDAQSPPPYLGYEPNAAWRAQAAAQIDQLRKGDLTIRVTDSAGNAVAGKRVAVRQQKHAFGFGTAVQAWRLQGADPAHAFYQQKVAEWFNLATLENNLKWPAWEGEWGERYSRSGALAALNWLANHGLRSRGHVLVWPSKEHLPNEIGKHLNNKFPNAAQQQSVRDLIATHIKMLTSMPRDLIATWDVVNEPRANHDLMDWFEEGDRAMATWFQRARDTNAKTKLALNEYGILTSSGSTQSTKQSLLESQLRVLIDAGAPIDAVGLQSHFNIGSITGPEQLWKIVDRYAALGLEVQITEFDFTTSDEQLQAAYTRDFLTAMFAHPGVTEVTFWGFLEGAMHQPQAALFRKDGSAKPNGQAYLDLVFGDWWTNTEAITDAEGVAVLRVFQGKHRVSFGDKRTTESISVPSEGANIVLRLP